VTVVAFGVALAHGDGVPRVRRWWWWWLKEKEQGSAQAGSAAHGTLSTKILKSK